MPQIDPFLKQMVAMKASDLHISSTFRPYLRVHGAMTQQTAWPELSPEQVLGLIREIAPAHNQRQFEKEQDTDFAYALPGTGRFRVNVFQDRYGPGAVFRTIPEDMPTAEQLGLPASIRSFSLLSKGLVLVTGPTGSGKSTTLAAIIDSINRQRDEHIITIEDPIEFVHKPIKCLVNQREVHRDTESFSRALRAALREDPDIVLVGEMRDLETIEIALETAETGHLVFGTVHTNSAAATIDRIIDKFPSDRQNQIRTLLGDTLQAVVAQTLCRKIGGGRVAAFEILIVNTPVAAHIREGKTFLIPSVMQTSRSLGMQTFSDDLIRLVQRGLITPQEAYVKAGNKEEMRVAMDNAGLPLDFLDVAKEAADEKKVAIESIIAELRSAIEADPQDPNSLNDLAWILATSPVDSLRNGREALKLAERMWKLIDQSDRAALVGGLDTLGTAYAASGSYSKAKEHLEKALQIAREDQMAELVGPLMIRFGLFSRGKPFIDESIGIEE